MVLRYEEQPLSPFPPRVSTWEGLPFPTALRLLVAEGDDELRRAICTAAATWQFGLASGPVASFTLITEASSLESAMRALASPVDVLIIDAQLGGASALDLVKYASGLDRAPVTLALSADATAAVGFQLATLGARGCLGKPVDIGDVRSSLAAILAEPPDLETSAKAQVGYRHIHTVQDEVKCAMLKRAFTLEGGNITRAAKRLGVTRTAVQQMLDRYGLPRSLTPVEQ
jgi:DNA-binding NtrC family response regulator